MRIKTPQNIYSKKNRTRTDLRGTIVRTMLLFSILLSIFFLFSHYRHNAILFGANAFTLFFFTFLLLWPTFRKNTRLLILVFGVYSTIFLWLMIYQGTDNGYGSLWSLLYPAAAFYLMSNTRGAIFSVIFIIGAALLMIGPIANFDYSPNFLIRFFGVYFFSAIIAYAYEFNRLIKEKNLHNQIQRRKKIALLLDKALDQAKNANAAKTLFLANMSHEIRTPLNAIIGAMQLLKMEIELDLDKDSTKNSYMRLIDDSSVTLLNLLNDILDISQIDSGKIHLRQNTFHPAKLFSHILSHFHHQAKQKNLTFIADIKSNLPRQLKGDDHRIRQILTNIISNAIKFTDKGFVFANIKHEPLSDNKIHLCIQIQDSGPGIPKEHQAIVFDSFVQVNQTRSRTHEGSGLGLAIARLITEKMGGSIELQSPVQKRQRFNEFQIDNPGTFIDITIPLEITSSTASIAAPNDWNTTELQFYKKICILVVEDNKVNQKIIKKQLESMGAHIIQAFNGQEALRKITESKEQNKKIDIILMDIHMPGMDGFETSAKIRAAQNFEPIIVLSAESMKEKILTNKNSDINGYLVKPVKMQDIYACINQFLDTK